jgi:hypothetical protein
MGVGGSGGGSRWGLERSHSMFRFFRETGPEQRVLSVDQDCEHVVWALAQHKPGAVRTQAVHVEHLGSRPAARWPTRVERC